MLSSKRDVDRHVQQLEAKISSESERNLKALSVAKLYMNVGDYETARRYLVRYLSVRDNSASAHRFLGQVYDNLRQRDRALDSYKKAYELDPSQKEAAAKVIEILVATAGEAHFDRAKAR